MSEPEVATQVMANALSLRLAAACGRLARRGSMCPRRRYSTTRCEGRGGRRRRQPRATLERELRRCRLHGCRVRGGASTACVLDAVGAARRAGAGLERELRRCRGGASASKVPRANPNLELTLTWN